MDTDKVFRMDEVDARSTPRIARGRKCVWHRSAYVVVGERSIWGEVRAKALVDRMEVRMPE